MRSTECDTNPRIHANDTNTIYKFYSCHSFKFVYWCCVPRCARAVGEHSVCDEAGPARARGAYRRENVGTSNHNAGEIPARRKTKASLAMAINQGLVGPKRMAKAGRDGYTVNIP